MRNLITIARISKIVAVAAVLAGSVAMVSAPKPSFNRHQKAYYLDPNVVAFVRPGLVTTIESAQIAADGTISAKFKITDPQGLPLDRTGVYTPGTVSTSFIAATIPAGAEQYMAYTTRVQKSPITGNSAVQAGTDSGGTYQPLGNGEYVYTFHTKAPPAFAAGATHAIGVYSSRDLSAFNLTTSYANNVFTFVPNGSPVTVTRDVIKTESCNQCHDPLSAHGGARRSVELCVLCHTPQTTDPDTGNTVDFKVMIHRIHAGSSLPSVKAGGKYQIIGFQQSVNDYSTVVFPADVRNCTMCHDQNSGAAQAKALFKPSMEACGACHDNVNFATGENHIDLAQPDNSQCVNCHTPQGELEFDASILGAHTIPRLSKQAPGNVFKLVSATGAAGQSPSVVFSIADNLGNAVAPSTMNRLALVLAGPTTDYASYVSEDPRKTAVANHDGTYTYKFKATIPAGATGTYSVGIEGYRSFTFPAGQRPNNPAEQTIRNAGLNQVLNFSVDGSAVAPRRTVVTLDNCNGCHSSLSVHGDNRNQIVMCVLCHNPNTTDADQRTAATNPPQTVDFRTMIHKIHTGENLTSDYTVIGFNKSVNNFNDIRFPGDRRDCEKCHANGSEQLPLSDSLLSVTTPRGYINPTPPTTAACIACHTDKSAASHAVANTTQLGEACVVCHGPNAQFSIDQVHAR